MDYFDNSALIENIQSGSPLAQKDDNGIVRLLIAGLIITAIVAIISFYRLQELEKARENI